MINWCGQGDRVIMIVFSLLAKSYIGFDVSSSFVFLPHHPLSFFSKRIPMHFEMTLTLSILSIAFFVSLILSNCVISGLTERPPVPCQCRSRWNPENVALWRHDECYLGQVLHLRLLKPTGHRSFTCCVITHALQFSLSSHPQTRRPIQAHCEPGGLCLSDRVI